MYIKVILVSICTSFFVTNAFANDFLPVEVNPKWEKQGVKIQIVEHLIKKYFEQPYRYNFDNPLVSSKKIDEYYYAMEGVHLPSNVKDEIKNQLVSYQNGIGKQTGFENTKGLATTLPRKQIVSISTAAN